MPRTGHYREPGTARSIVIGVIPGVIGVGSCVIFRDLLGNKAEYLLSMTAVLIASNFGGFTAGIASTVASMAILLAAWYAGLYPGAVPAHAVRYALFAGAGYSIARISGQMKRNAASAQQSAAEYQELSDSIPQLVWTASGGGADHFNSRWTAYSGRSAPELRGKGWLESVHPDERATILTKMEECLRAGKGCRAALRLRRADGMWRWFDVAAVAVAEDGSPARLVISASDIQDERDLRQQLTSESQRFAAIVESVPGVLYAFLLTKENRPVIPFAAGPIQELIGLNAAEVTANAETFFRNIYPGDVERVWQSIRLAVATRLPWRQEFRYNHPERGVIWLEGSSRPGTAMTAGPVTWFGVLTNVTERRQEQEMAREWQRAFEQCELAIGLSNAETNSIKAVNEAFARQHGYARNELIGRPTASVYPPEEVETLRRHLHDADNGSGHALFETKQRRSDGTEFPAQIDLTAVRGPDGRIGSRIAIIHDLTERKRIEDRLARSEALYRAISENLPDTAVFVVDSDLRYVAAAGALAAQLDFGAGRIVGYSPAELFEAGVAGEVTARYRRALAGKTVLAERVQDGRTLESAYVPMRDNSGRITAAMGIVRDVTARREAQAQVQRLNEELEGRVQERTTQLIAVNRELESFAWSVSHDLRAPLRGIDGWSQALAEDCAEAAGESGREYIRRIRAEAGHMATLIDSLLDLARLSRAEMHEGPVDLSKIAERQAALLRDGARDRNIAFRIQPDLTTWGDAELLERALANLLENAVKFTAGVAEAQVDVGRNQHGEYFVKDNGAGFDMAHATYLFGAFQRLHRASEFPGTGIGLATVQRVILRHGGSVRAEARPGEGATFYFHLPPA